MGSVWLTQILTALGLGALRAGNTGQTVDRLVYLALIAAGQKAGSAAEAVNAREAELKSQKEASDARDRMHKPALPLLAIAMLWLITWATTPFRQTFVPPVRPHHRVFRAQRADQIQRLSPGAAPEQVMLDFARLRNQERACANLSA